MKGVLLCVVWLRSGFTIVLCISVFCIIDFASVCFTSFITSLITHHSSL